MPTPKLALLLFVLVTSTACGGDDETSTDEAGDSLAPEDQAEIDALPSELQQMVDGAHAYYQASPEPKACPHVPGYTGSEAGFTPDLIIDCSIAPEGRCIPVANGGGAGQYDPALWTENPIWVQLGFEKTEPHIFHYDFWSINDAQGICSFSAEAKGDLDGDGVFSSYRIIGTIDGEGVHASPLEVVDGLE